MSLPTPLRARPGDAADAALRHKFEYAQRMNRVLDHIDRHLDQNLALADLAELAHFSPFHFHRVFAAWMGETLGDYLWRRRVEVGALRLAHERRSPVLAVALSVGFGSGEAFARAFKQRFGCSPTAWRAHTAQRWAAQLAHIRSLAPQAADRNLDQVLRNPDQAPSQAISDHERPNLTSLKEYRMDVRVEDLAPARVAYLRHIGPYGPEIPRFWAETFQPWRAVLGLGGGACYGIGWDDPAITAPEKCRYDACVEVPADFVAQSPASLADLPGGRYAVAHYEGVGADIGRAWVELMRDWLPASGMQCDNRPMFEYYAPDDRMDPATGVFRCRLCVPVKAL